MSERDETKVDHGVNLMTVALMLVNDGAAEDDITVKWLENAAAEIERLTAEIERLTPKDIKPNEAVDILIRHRFMGNTDWYCNSFGTVIGGHSIAAVPVDSCPRFGLKDATMIAQGLLRDGAEGGA